MALALHQRSDRSADTCGNFLRVPSGPLPPSVCQAPSMGIHTGAVGDCSRSASRSMPASRQLKVSVTPSAWHAAVQ
ncbi:MAG TPA: hypothetical protein VHL79_11115 [Ramlibacter sp.]|nr:hypothetical protein [Ramlibacter sp.]